MPRETPLVHCFDHSGVFSNNSATLELSDPIIDTEIPLSSASADSDSDCSGRQFRAPRRHNSDPVMLSLQQDSLSSVSVRVQFDTAVDTSRRRRVTQDRIQEIRNTTRDIQRMLRRGSGGGNISAAEEIVLMGHQDSLAMNRRQRNRDASATRTSAIAATESISNQPQQLRMVRSWGDDYVQGLNDRQRSPLLPNEATFPSMARTLQEVALDVPQQQPSNSATGVQRCSDPLEVSLRVEDLVQSRNNSARQLQLQQRAGGLFFGGSHSGSLGSSLGTASSLGDASRSSVLSSTLEKFFADSLALSRNQTHTSRRLTQQQGANQQQESQIDTRATENINFPSPHTADEVWEEDLGADVGGMEDSAWQTFSVPLTGNCSFHSVTSRRSLLSSSANSSIKSLFSHAEELEGEDDDDFGEGGPACQEAF